MLAVFKHFPFGEELFVFYWYEYLLVIVVVFLACESLHVCTACIWRCKHARFVWTFLCTIFKFSSIHSFHRRRKNQQQQTKLTVVSFNTTFGGYIHALSSVSVSDHQAARLLFGEDTPRSNTCQIAGLTQVDIRDEEG